MGAVNHSRLPTFPPPKLFSDMNLKHLVVSAFLIAVFSSLTIAAAQEAWKLRPLRYHQPDLAVDLGVGLWAWPMPMDYDNDGDLDLLVA